MNVSKRFGAWMLGILLLTMCLMLGACGGETTAEPTSGSNTTSELEYRVTVVDGAGTPYTTGVIVQFMQNGQKVALQTVDGKGHKHWCRIEEEITKE